MGNMSFIFLLLLLVGCQSDPTKYDIGKCHLLPTITKLSDSYDGSRELWTSLNAHFVNKKSKKRKLAVFLDGTGNTGKDRTNIREMYKLSVKHACDDNPVIPYYDKGVGAKYFDRVRGGASGKGIGLNIQQAYQFLVEAYQADDKIFIFGFSRGAYTARSLNGMIELAGLLDKKYVKKSRNGELNQSDLKHKVAEIYSSYHVKSEDPKSIRPLVNNNIQNNKDLVSVKLIRVPVEGIGVFETVAALGLRRVPDPKKHHTNLYAKSGVHALAIDEIRDDFELLRFNQDIDHKQQKLEEMWFAGVHSNVGGGYDVTPGCNTTKPSDKYYYDGLESTPLNWMIGKFRNEGIFPIRKPFNECRLGRMHDEYYDTWFPPYRLMGTFIREANHDDIVHDSVKERIRSKVLRRYHPQRESNGRYMPTNTNLQIMEHLIIK